MEIQLFKKQKKSANLIKAHAPEMGEQVLHDWKLMLFSFALLLLATVFFDGYLLLKINHGDFFKPAEPTETAATEINRKILIDAAGFYDLRAKNYEAFKVGTSTEIDPSL